jgi:hypothetical protein
MTAKKHPPNNPTDKSKSKYGIFLLVRVWTQYTKLRVVIRSDQFLDKIIEKYICNKKKIIQGRVPFSCLLLNWVRTK